MRPEIHTPPLESRVSLSTRGPVTPGEVGYAREKILAALSRTGRQILYVHARLTRVSDPAVEKPARLQVTVDVRGRPISVSGSAATMLEAVDLAENRLRERLRRTAVHWQAVRGRQPTGQPNEWRHTQRRRGQPQNPPAEPET